MLVAHLVRGAKAGVVAGLVFGLFVALVGTPLVGVAEELGHGDHHAGGGAHEGDGHEHAASAVSAATTTAASVAGGVLWGLLLGVVAFGGAFYLLEPAIPGTGGARSYVLGAAGFVTVSGAPWLVLPPTPPGVEAALSVETRLGVYAATMLAGALACALAVVGYRRGRAAASRPVGALAASVPLLVLATVGVIAPVPTAPAAASAALPDGLAAGYVGAVAFGQLVLWLVLAATHAHLQPAPGGATNTPGLGDDHAPAAASAD
ncbi:CbtA family protein [Halorubellus sp. JP-L1]|uniref:CbtA family protein n=1 Tax=Halorubellus sp. JP-L1 TaxID=2715753 RepID=UPI001408B0DA|nr:CbtA family protein [Halorubellus sp. JP-L1]NHN41675.1 CbtA family protein [Halorubellus sp. JP-L1]